MRTKKTTTFWLLVATFLSILQILQGQQFTPTTFNGEIITKDKVSGFIETQELKYQELKNSQNYVELVKTLISLSQLNRTQLNYSASYNYAGEALFLAEESKDSKLLMLAHQEYGLLNYLFKQDAAAGHNLKQSLKYAKQAFSKNRISPLELYSAYYNDLLYYQRMENLEAMKCYIDTCQSFMKQYQWGVEKEIYIKEKTAFILQRKNEVDSAIMLLKEVEKEITHNKALSAHKSFLIVIQGVLADRLRNSQQTKEADIYFRKALSQEDSYGEHTFYIEYLHTKYASLLNKMGDTKNAYLHMQKAKQINDQFLNPRKDETQNFLSIKDRYREELEHKNERLQAQAIELAEEKASFWRFRVFFFVLLLLFTITIFLILRKRQQHKHQMENKAFLERRRYNEALIETKNKELTSGMLQLIEKEEIIKKLSEQLKEVLPANKSKALMKSIELQSTSLWDDFNNRFMAQNADFYKRLQKKTPKLSSADLKVCALIKLNFSGKEMAYLLGISEGSVHVARHRLRKKFELGREVNLVQYINSI